MRNSLYSVSLEDALQTVGGHGKYQKHLLITVSSVWLVQAMFMMNLPYMLSTPTLICEQENCCHGKFEISKDSIQNLANEWELACGKEYKSTLISLAYFIGFGIGTYFISYLANRYGRKVITISSLVITSVNLFISAASPSPEFFMVFSLISGVFVGGTSITAFIYIHECVDGDYRNIYAGVVFAAWGLGMMIMSLINIGISEWRVHMIIIGMLNLIIALPLMKFYESPRFLASNQGKYSKARYILNLIASYNKKQPFAEMLEGEKVIGYQEPNTNPVSESTTTSPKYSFVPISNGIISVAESESTDIKRYSCCDIIKLKSIRRVVIVISLLWFILSFSYYGVVFSIPNYIGNPHLNGMIIALAETLSYIVMAFILNKIGRVLGLIINFGVSGVCCLMALAFIHSSCSNDIVCKANSIVQLTLLSLARFSIASVRLISYIYAVEYFPTSVRSLVFGLLGLISLLGSICCPLLILLSSIIKIHPLFFIGLLLVTASFFSCLLTETLGKNMEDYVDEEKEEMKNPGPIKSIDMGSPFTKDSDRNKETARNKDTNRKFEKLNEERPNS
jgi:MFS family permease